jgi:UDP-N-acetylglucosamine transferase subunit ALG13
VHQPLVMLTGLTVLHVQKAHSALEPWQVKLEMSLVLAHQGSGSCLALLRLISSTCPVESGLTLPLEGLLEF